MTKDNKIGDTTSKPKLKQKTNQLFCPTCEDCDLNTRQEVIKLEGKKDVIIQVLE